MAQLISGLLIFLGVHSLQALAPAQRERLINTYGPLAYKGAYSVLSLFGLIVLSGGYALARQEPVLLWVPPVGLSHLASLFTLLSFVLLAAAYVPRNHIRHKLKHPMLIGVKLWAFGHLLANGGLHDLVLFGGFLVWSVLVFRSARRRPQAEVAAEGAPELAAGGAPEGAAEVAPEGPAQTALPMTALPMTALAVAVGLVSWAWFAFMGHAWLIGVAPFAR